MPQVPGVHPLYLLRGLSGVARRTLGEDGHLDSGPAFRETAEASRPEVFRLAAFKSGGYDGGKSQHSSFHPDGTIEQFGVSDGREEEKEEAG